MAIQIMLLHAKRFGVFCLLFDTSNFRFYEQDVCLEGGEQRCLFINLCLEVSDRGLALVLGSYWKTLNRCGGGP